MKRAIVETVSKYLNAGYSLGSKGPGTYDCLSFIVCFYRDAGFHVPEEFEGLSLENYANYYKANPVMAKRKFIRFLRTIGSLVDPKYMQPGDLVVTKGRDYAAFIYIGSGNVIGIHTPYGVVVLPRDKLKDPILEVRRPCPRQPR